jgi:nitrite reductase/ring-hydroxylating ferredoxin subunit
MGRSALVVLMVGLAGVTPAAAVTVDRDYHETFDVREGVSLDLRHGDGDVTITPWNRDVIEVRVRYLAEVKRVGFGGVPDFSVDFDQTDDTVRVIGRENVGSGVVLFQSVNEHEYTYTISAPSYVVLELHGGDGDVAISGWRSNIDCALDDGDVRLENIANDNTRIVFKDGDVFIDGLAGGLEIGGDDGSVTLSRCRVARARISVEDGDVVATECRGGFDVSVDDGRVVLDGLESERVEVRAEDGDVEASLVGSGSVDVEVTTDDGDVSLTLAPGLSYAFVVETDDAEVQVDVPDVSDFEQREHHVSGQVRGGAGRVQVTTADGDVVLRED